MKSLTAWSQITILLVVTFCVISRIKGDGTTTPAAVGTTKKSGPTPMPIGYPDENGPTTTTPRPTPNPTSLTTETQTDDYELAKKRLAEMNETWGKKKRRRRR